MTNLILGIVFLLLALLGIVLKKTYFALPLHELKRRAEKHDEVAVKLYKTVAYGSSLRSLLWLYIGLLSAASFILFARQMPIYLSLLIIGPLIYIVFSLIPSRRVSKVGLGITKLFTPILAWLLYYLHPLLTRSTGSIERRYLSSNNHTGLYERYDLIELIERQQKQHDNRLSNEELDIVKHALNFDERKVSEILTPRKKVKTVLMDDTIGPILINELHESAQDYVFVKESKKGPVIGTLAFKDLGVHSKGQVKNHMSDNIYYLHESDSLSEALHAFFVTNHSVFVVINGFEEFVGIVTIEAILKELLGHIPREDFEDYSNIGSVASRHDPKKKEEAEINEETETKEATPVKTDKEVVE